MKKFLPYILILVILVGILAPSLVRQVQAAPDDDDLGSCTRTLGSGAGQTSQTAHNVKKKDCTGIQSSFRKYDDTYQPPGGITPGEYTTTGIPPQKENKFRDRLDPCASLMDGSFMGCVQQGTYILFVSVPSFILGVVAKFFNFSIALTLSSNFYNLPFIAIIWKVIRDFSNIAFILVLLYAAFQTILGLGHGGAKKIIGTVVLIALIVNFSLFFTKIVIDSSNILALVFYNQIKVVNEPSDAVKVSNPKKTGVEEKNIAGALTSGFEINAFFNQLTFEVVKVKQDGLKEWSMVAMVTAAAAKVAVATAAGPAGIAGAILAGLGVGIFNGTKSMTMESSLLIISVMMAYGIVISILAYSFFIAALAFFGRMMNLIMLMVVSPFAFVSYTIPSLKKIDTIGFDSWIHKLMESSFVAAVFLFIIYVIAVILQNNPFDAVFMRGPEISSQLITLFMPAVLIAILLLKATKYTQKASGEFAGTIVGFGKAVAGLAAGVAIGGGIGLAAKGLQGTLGHAGKAIFESKSLAEWETKGNWMQRKLAGTTRTAGEKMSTSSFDARKGIIGAGLKLAGGASGINLGHDSKLFGEEGGYEGDLKRRDEKRKKRAEGLKVKEGEPEKQHLNQLKEEQQRVTLDNEHKIHDVEREIKSAEATVRRLKDVATASRSLGEKDGKPVDPERDKKQREYQEAADQVKTLYSKRSAIKDGLMKNTDGLLNTHNGNASEEGVKALIKEEERSAAKRAKAKDDYDTLAGASNGSPEDIALVAQAQKELEAAQTAEVLAKSMASAARAAQAFTLAEKAQAEAAKNPGNTALSDAASAAATRAELLLNEANTAVTNVETLGNAEETLKARKRVENASKGLGNSQNDYEDHLVPNAEHHLKQVNDERTWAYADNIQNQWSFPWNEAARKKSAHEIRMGVKPEKHSGGHGGHEHGGSDFLEHLAASFITHAGTDAHSAPAAAPKGGGDGHHG
jgi:hypothetical protein